MRVKTLDNELFAGKCRELEDRVRTSGFVPDAVVGIAKGGDFVAAQMYSGVPHVSVSCRRPSTAVKDKAGALMRLIRRCPLWVRDGLRMFEARFFACRQGRPRHPVFDAGAVELLKKAGRVLIVDDSVDSGATLLAVVNAIRKLQDDGAPHDVRAAVLTVTTRNPVVLPDYFLYNNYTLLRFPWSKDMTI